jgi:hypothetical protein
MRLYTFAPRLKVAVYRMNGEIRWEREQARVMLQKLF